MRACGKGLAAARALPPHPVLKRRRKMKRTGQTTNEKGRNSRAATILIASFLQVVRLKLNYHNLFYSVSEDKQGEMVSSQLG